MEITLQSVTQLAKMLSDKKISSLELTTEYLKKIQKKDKHINSYITVTEELALKKAKESDERRFKGNTLGILDGIPYSLKDNIITSGIPTTCASRMLKDFIPDYDSEVYKRLNNTGAVLLGKNNMDEFAMGSSTVSSHFNMTSNPHNTDYVAGGSSGGSAAAVSAGLCAFSLGTDTGGSIRQPASFCGVYGLCPTYGRVSRYGLVSFASSLDRIGPLARTPKDLAIIMSVISGKDEKDETSVITDNNFLTNKAIDFSSLKIAIIKEMPTNENASSGTRNVFNSAIDFFKKKKADIKEYSLGEIMNTALTAYYIISSAEASSNLAKYDGLNYGYCTPSFDSLKDMYKKTRTEGFGTEVKKRIMLGTYVLSAGYTEKYYLKAQDIRKKLTERIKEILNECDIILTPAAPLSAYTKKFAAQAGVKLYPDDVFSSFVNLSGVTALSIPFGYDTNSMPIGIQLIGDKFSENNLIRIAGGIKNEI